MIELLYAINDLLDELKVILYLHPANFVNEKHYHQQYTTYSLCVVLIFRTK